MRKLTLSSSLNVDFDWMKNSDQVLDAPVESMLGAGQQEMSRGLKSLEIGDESEEWIPDEFDLKKIYLSLNRYKSVYLQK